jgi:hypothetical protein
LTSPVSTMLVPLGQANVSYGPPSTIARFTWYPLAPTDACQESETCASPATAVRPAGGAKLISRVVDAVWLIVPLAPVIVSDNA